MGVALEKVLLASRVTESPSHVLKIKAQGDEVLLLSRMLVILCFGYVCVSACLYVCPCLSICLFAR